MFFVFSSVMTSQRSSWVGSILLILFLLLYLLRTKKRKVFFQVSSIFVIGIIAIFIIYGRNLFVETQVTSKSLSRYNAIGERFTTWSRLFENTNIWFGRGLGTGGHRARSISALDTVTDGNYAKIIGETGIVGIVLFIMICILWLSRQFKDNFKDKAAIFIIVFILLQAFGSNIIALQVTAPVFWVAMGIKNNQNIAYNLTVKSSRPKASP